MNRRLVFLGVVAAVSAAACGSDKRATLTAPFGSTAFGYQMGNLATNLPRGSVRFRFKATPAAVTPDSFKVILQGIDSLASGSFYTAWAGDSLGTTFKRITGLLTRVRLDSSLDASRSIVTRKDSAQIGSFSAIANGGPRTQYIWEFERTAAGLTASDSMVTFLISIESSNAATSPNATRRPLWARRSDATPAAGISTPTFRLGNFAGDSGYVNRQYLYSATPARGRGVIWGKILEVTDSTLARPPKGYYYAVYAFKGRDPGVTTGGDTLFVGELTSPWPRRHLSLYNADSVITDPEVVTDLPRQIYAGWARISADTVAKLPLTPCSTNVSGDATPCPFFGYTEVRLTLESKNAIRGRMGPARLLGGPVPFVITSGQYK